MLYIHVMVETKQNNESKHEVKTIHKKKNKGLLYAFIACISAAVVIGIIVLIVSWLNKKGYIAGGNGRGGLLDLLLIFAICNGSDNPGTCYAICFIVLLLIGGVSTGAAYFSGGRTYRRYNNRQYSRHRYPY